MTVDNSSYYEFFDFRLDVENEQLLKNGETVQITHKAFQILHLLVQNSGQITKKEDIFNQLWTDSFVEEANLTQHIYVLRKALGRTPDNQSYIETVPKQGYRFTLLPEQIIKTNGFAKVPAIPGEYAESDKTANGEVKSEINESNDSDQSKSLSYVSFSADKAEEPLLQSAVHVSQRGFFSKPILAILLIVVFGLSVGAFYFLQKRQETAAVAHNVKSIAVLPFKPIGEEVDKEKLGLGMADAIIMQLSKLQKIEIRPTSAIFRYTDQPAADAASAGRDLRVDAVLEGTVQSDGERVRVSVQLLRVSDGKSLWAETFHEKVSDIFAVQDLISKEVVSALSLQLTPQQQQVLKEHGTRDHAAFLAYQLGVYFWNRRTKDDLSKAVEHFQEAVNRDPDYAQAYAGLADAYSMLGYYGFADVSEMKEKAKVAAEKALALNDSVAEAYVALAMAYVLKKENYAKAQELLERAVGLAPYSGSVRHRYGWILLINGKVNESAQQMRLAKDYDPLSQATNRAYCSVLIMQRNFPEALRHCENAIEIYINTPNSRRVLARAYFYNGKYADAFEQLEIQTKSNKGNERFNARSEMAYYYAKLGQTAQAETIYAELKQEFKKEADHATGLTLVAYALGKKDEAQFYFKEMLKHSAALPDQHLSLAYDPFWDEVRADPQFAPLFPK